MVSVVKAKPNGLSFVPPGVDPHEHVRALRKKAADARTEGLAKLYTMQADAIVDALNEGKEVPE